MSISNCSIIRHHTDITRQAAEVACDEIYDHCVPAGSLSSPLHSVRAREPGDKANSVVDRS